MNETYRISNGTARRQLVMASAFVAIVLMFCAWRWHLQGRDDWTSVATIAMAVIITTVYFRKTYDRSRARAARHALILTPDAILMRDGATERRVPYSSIERLKVRRSPISGAYFILRIEGVGEESYYGYENIERLISSLASHVPTDRIDGKTGPA